MSREKALTELQMEIYLLNLTAVCLIAGVMAASLHGIVDIGGAAQFLNSVQHVPWRPENILIMSISSYLLLILFSGINQILDGKERLLHMGILAAEILFCVASTVAMNMNYNGLVLLVVTDVIRGTRGSRQKVLLGITVVILYAVLDYNLVGGYFGMIPWDAFIACYGSSTRTLLLGGRSILVSANLVLFILYMAMMIQGEYLERERIQSLNDQLEEANGKLKAYAAEAEKNAETRERNRLAREIHDTLGHALTGIVAGIDACETMIDFSPELTKQQLHKVGDVARQGITDVRRSVNKLRPDALEKMELEAAIQKMLEDVAVTSKAKVIFDNQVHPLAFHEDEEEVIYRVVQEASTNAVRHGHATHIAIRISKIDEWLTIRVKDNGVGCGNVTQGFGLKHMEERLQMLGGTLAFDGQDGFEIVARIPIRWGEEYDR